ncbi:MAG: hypothetical protein WAO55_07895 [Candidatus Manganitrophaceae bacterium]
MNARVPPVPTPQCNHVVRPTLYGSNELERTAACARLVRETNTIGQLISNKRNSATEENGDEQARAGRTKWHGAIVVVDNFRDDQILKEVHSPVAIALGGDPPGLRRGVDIE